MPSTFVEDKYSPNDIVEVEDTFKKEENSIGNNDIDDYISKFLDISNNAKQNDKEEKNMSLIEGLRTFPKAAAWSIVLSTSIIMEGYDTTLMSSFFGIPAFKEKYGEYYNGSYEIPTRWQTGIQASVQVGEIVGLFIAGIISDRIGYRFTLIGSLILVIAFIFIPFFAKNIEMILAGEFLLGIPWGAFQTLSVSYASEVCPLVLRPYLTTYINICWCIGQLVASGVLRGFVSNETSLAYRVPFAIQWAWPVEIMIGIILAPESPWWLAKKGKTHKVEVSLRRFINTNKNVPSKDILAKAMLQKIEMTLSSELDKVGDTSYIDCFKGVDFRRTRITCILWVLQSVCGANSLMGYAAYFFIQAGMADDMSFAFTMIMYAIGIIGTIVSWFATSHCGRFKLFFGGLCCMGAVLLIVGGLGCSSQENASWGIGALLIVFAFIYNCTVGPLVYCLITEIPSTRLRTKTIILARNTYNITGIVVQVITPYMLNPTAWNWQGKSGFLWGGFCIVGAIWTFFELPETKRRTFAEIDVLFHNKVPARKFKEKEVDVFDAGDLLRKNGEEKIRKLVEDNEINGTV